MEGDAGARQQLNPIGVQDSSDAESGGADTGETTPAESVTPGADETAPAADTETEPGVDASSDVTSDEAVASDEAEASDYTEPSRLGRRWFVAICAALVLLTAGAAFAGYSALRFHKESETVATADNAALKAAMDCVSATQAPDTAAMASSQGKILECTTGNFGTQAVLFSGVLVDAYKAANVSVQVSEMRAAIENHNQDGSLDVLVALRTKVTNSEAADQEQGYRLRVQMTPVDGTYKISDLKQVTS